MSRRAELSYDMVYLFFRYWSQVLDLFNFIDQAAFQFPIKLRRSLFFTSQLNHFVPKLKAQILKNRCSFENSAVLIIYILQYLWVEIAGC